MRSGGLQILTAAVLLAAVPQGAVAQAPRAGGGLAAPVGVAAPVVPHVAPPPVVAPPAITPVVPPATGHVYSPPAVGLHTLPSVHAPAAGAAGIPVTPRLSAPVGAAGNHAHFTGRASSVGMAGSVARPAVTGVSPHAPGNGQHLRHRRIAHGFNPGLLSDDPGSRATCGWVWLRRPGHRRLHLYRCM
jgi:hypothetical protein